MMAHRRSGQRGITFIGLVFTGVVLAAAGVVTAQVIPTLIELSAVHKAINRAATDGQTVYDVRAVFDKAAQVDDIKAIEGKDLIVTKVGDRIVVQFAYQREIHLFGPAWLTLKYEGQSK
jgi:alpha-D-ribose 1-methylphosphonate 5-phosphate C-P lyase